MPLSDKEIEHRVRRRAAVKRIREFIATKSAVNYDQTPYARELRRRIQANQQTHEYLLAELGRPNVSAVVKTLVEREIQEVEIRSSAVKHRTINGRCRTGTIRRVIPPGCGVIAPRSIRPLSFTPYRLWRHPMVRPMISDNELQAPR